jgi:hypothetical protein
MKLTEKLSAICPVHLAVGLFHHYIPTSVVVTYITPDVPLPEPLM